MLYLLGGVARAGKTTVAHRFLAQTGIPFFSLDYLMMGCANGAPQLGVDPNDDDRRTAERLTPLIKAMAVAMLENSENYLLEGVQLRPALVAELIAQFGNQVRACFLGYAEIDVTTKVQHIRDFDGGTNDWLRHAGEQELNGTAQWLIEMSQTVRSDCHTYGLRYFDLSNNFMATLDEVVAYFQA